MDSELLCGMENFAEVWKRVRGDSPPPEKRESDSTAALLRRRMDEKYAQLLFYASLAKNRAVEEQRLLLQLCAAEKRHFRCLQLEYFLLTGHCHTVARSCACKACLLHGARLALQRERESAQTLQADAEAAQGTLQKTLLQLSKEDEKHARQLYALLHKRIVGGQ